MNKAKIDKELFEKLAMEDVLDESSFRAEISKHMEESSNKKNLLPKSLSMKHSCKAMILRFQMQLLLSKLN